MNNVPSFFKYVKRIFDNSQSKVPVKSGELKNSGKIITHSEDEFEIKYDAEHSMTVHEDLQARHNNGQAKYLENAVDEEINQCIKEYTKDVMDFIRKG